VTWWLPSWHSFWASIFWRGHENAYCSLQVSKPLIIITSNVASPRSEAQAHVCSPVRDAPWWVLLQHSIMLRLFFILEWVSRAFSALCVYLKFGHRLQPLGCLCAKFGFFRCLHCWASLCRNIAYSIAHSPSLFDALGTEHDLVVTEVRSESFGLVSERRHYNARHIFIDQCGIARFRYAMRVFKVWESSLPLGYTSVPNFVSFAASIAKLAHAENRVLNQSLTQPLTQVTWFAGNRSFRFGIIIWQFIGRRIMVKVTTRASLSS